MRHWLVLLHRYVGLLLAGFLLITGLTGAIISWDHELDDVLNPHLMAATSTGSSKNPLELATELEQRYPQIKITFFTLQAESGKSLMFWAEPAQDAKTGALTQPGFNQIFVDPVSGQELGKREWGAVWPISSENLVSFLYKLHYSLHIPAFWGSDRWGVWLLGVIALIWTIDCFTGALLTFPARRRASANPAKPVTQPKKSWFARWKPAWKIRWGSGPYKINFDLHRAGSLWTWGLLFIVAFTAFSLNLYREVFFPAMSLVSDVTPTPFDTRTPASIAHQPKLNAPAAVAAASVEAVQRQWTAPAGSVFYDRWTNVYAIAFYRPDDDHGAGGVGHPQLYLDGDSGQILGAKQPWQGSAADVFVQAQFPLHSGRILGLPGRIMMSIFGLIVAMLSVTGVYIWWKKHRGRQKKHD
ncbi:PepSY-associated TM helix domain-containing protein [Chitinibacter sp. S2-10]|uniref:PepSY-associated TM helix domain-containing protein n=1 Tax=Chitinibacter sp. S2-10 TaxID=3373597 RepID=UPI003977BADE